jgi:hypothetical protein
LTLPSDCHSILRMTLFNHLFGKFQPALAKLFPLCLLAILLAACGKPFNVKPRPDVKVATPNTPVSWKAEGESKGVTIQAAAVTDEDYLYDTFEANLLLAGVLPVHLKLTNTGAEAAELRRAKLEIKAQNKNYKIMDSHKAYKRLMSFYGISIYNKHGHKESRADFDTHAFDLKKPLAAGESREGLIYFAIPNEIIKSGNLNLLARKLSAGRAKDDSLVELNLK